MQSSIKGIDCRIPGFATNNMSGASNPVHRLERSLGAERKHKADTSRHGRGFPKRPNVAANRRAGPRAPHSNGSWRTRVRLVRPKPCAGWRNRHSGFPRVSWSCSLSRSAALFTRSSLAAASQMRDLAILDRVALRALDRKASKAVTFLWVRGESEDWSQ